MKRRADPFTQYTLAKEKELLGEDASPELTHAFRMGVYIAAKWFTDSLAKRLRNLQGPVN
jgi:hypothetical protein